MENRELHELLGLHWHERITSRLCNCGFIPTGFEIIESHISYNNPDYTSDAGKVQLLREMILKCKDWDGFVDRIGARIGGQAYFHHAFILDTNGLCRDQAIVWLKRDERTD